MRGALFAGFTITPGISRCSASANVSFIHVSITRAFSTAPVFFIDIISLTLFSNDIRSAYSSSPRHLALLYWIRVVLFTFVDYFSPSLPSWKTDDFAGVACLFAIILALFKLFAVLYLPFSASYAACFESPTKPALVCAFYKFWENSLFLLTVPLFCPIPFYHQWFQLWFKLISNTYTCRIHRTHGIVLCDIALDSCTCMGLL